MPLRMTPERNLHEHASRLSPRCCPRSRRLHRGRPCAARLRVCSRCHRRGGRGDGAYRCRVGDQTRSSRESVSTSPPCVRAALPSAARLRRPGCHGPDEGPGLRVPPGRSPLGAPQRTKQAERPGRRPQFNAVHPGSARRTDSHHRRSSGPQPPPDCGAVRA